MLTFIRGIGIILTAGVSAKIGPVDTLPSLGRLCSYAGIIPRLKQTGEEAQADNTPTSAWRAASCAGECYVPHEIRR